MSEVIHLMLEHWIYLIPIAAVGYLLWNRRSTSAADAKAMLQKGALILDVQHQGRVQGRGSSESHQHTPGRIGERLPETGFLQAHPHLLRFGQPQRPGRLHPEAEGIQGRT